jgi:hypothetical protein
MEVVIGIWYCKRGWVYYQYVWYKSVLVLPSLERESIHISPKRHGLLLKFAQLPNQNCASTKILDYETKNKKKY